MNDEGPGRGGGGAAGGEASSGRGGIGGAGESPQRRMEKPHGTQREHTSSGRGGIGGAGESPQRRMEKPHGTQREHHIGVLQIIIMVRWGNHPTGQDKGDGFSMSGDPRLDRIQLEEQSLWERIAQTTSTKRLPSVLPFTG